MKSKIIIVDNHKCKISLVKGIIKENDFVISIHRFNDMDKFGIYKPLYYKNIDVEIEKAIYINIGTVNEPNIVLGFSNGGCCGSALQAMYSIVEINLI